MFRKIADNWKKRAKIKEEILDLEFELCSTEQWIDINLDCINRLYSEANGEELDEETLDSITKYMYNVIYWHRIKNGLKNEIFCLKESYKLKKERMSNENR